MRMPDPWPSSRPLRDLRADEDGAAASARLFHALGHSTRLRVLAWLLYQPSDARSLALALDVERNNLMHHLETLAGARFIRLDGRQWSVEPGALGRVADLLRGHSVD